MLNNETIYELTQGIEFMGYEHMIFYCENVIKTKSESKVYLLKFTKQHLLMGQVHGEDSGM